MYDNTAAARAALLPEMPAAAAAADRTWTTAEMHGQV